MITLATSHPRPACEAWLKSGSSTTTTKVKLGAEVAEFMVGGSSAEFASLVKSWPVLSVAANQAWQTFSPVSVLVHLLHKDTTDQAQQVLWRICEPQMTRLVLGATRTASDGYHSPAAEVPADLPPASLDAVGAHLDGS